MEQQQNPQSAQELVLASRVTAEDYRAAVHFNLYWKQRYMAPLLIGGCVASVGRITLHLLGVLPAKQVLLWGCLFYLVAVLGIYLIAERQIGKYASSVRSTLGKEQLLAYTQAGVIDRTGGEEKGNFPWRFMREGYETKENFLFFLSDNSVIEQPKREMTPQEILQVRTLAQNGMKKDFQVRVKTGE